MISLINEHGKQYITLFGRKVFVISQTGVALLPRVHTKPIEWSEIRNKPAAGLLFTTVIAQGAVNGINKYFSTSQKFDSVQINGITQIEGLHYTRLSDTSFQLSDAPLVGDIVTTNFIQ